jgi:hypothetical protein
MSNKTWNLTLNPHGDEPATVTGLSQAEMVRIVSELMHGVTPAIGRVEASSHESGLAA